MSKLLSKLNTSVAYDGGAAWRADPANPKHKVTLKPGLNEVSDLDGRLLAVDPHFVKHQAGGFYQVVQEPAGDRDPNDVVALDGTNTAPALKATGTEASDADPRVKLDGEADDVYAARVAAWQTTRRAKLDGEKPAAYKARIAGYDADDAEYEARTKDAAFVATFYSLPEADRDAYYGTLSDQEKALVDANKPALAAPAQE